MKKITPGLFFAAKAGGFSVLSIRFRFAESLEERCCADSRITVPERSAVLSVVEVSKCRRAGSVVAAKLGFPVLSTCYSTHSVAADPASVYWTFTFTNQTVDPRARTSMTASGTTAWRCFCSFSMAVPLLSFTKAARRKQLIPAIRKQYSVAAGANVHKDEYPIILGQEAAGQGMSVRSPPRVANTVIAKSTLYNGLCIESSFITITVVVPGSVTAVIITYCL